MNVRRTKKTDRENGSNDMNMMTKISPITDAPAATSPGATSSAEWNGLLLDYHKAKKIADTACDKWEAAQGAWEASCGKYPDVELDGRKMTGKFLKDVYGFATRSVSEARGWPIRDCIGKEWRDAMARIRRVDLEDKRRYRQVGLPELYDEQDSADQKRYEAWCALCEYPVTDLQSLVRKMDFIESEGRDLSDFGEEIVADVRRITSSEGAA